MSHAADWPFSPDLNRAIEKVPREVFVPDSHKREAQGDYPLPIGHGQTISQPSLVAYMTEELNLNSRARVLDVGTGSGYQAALLAELCAEVFTIERIPELAQSARERLESLGYRNIHYRTGDGYAGWPEAAPFDGIIVAAAAKAIPQALKDQLSLGARMIIPIGSLRGSQKLLCVERTPDGFDTKPLIDVRFVPLIADA